MLVMLIPPSTLIPTAIQGTPAAIPTPTRSSPTLTLILSHLYTQRRTSRRLTHFREDFVIATRRSTVSNCECLLLSPSITMAMHPSPRSSTPAHSTLTHALPHTMHLTAARPLNTYLRLNNINPHGTLMTLLTAILIQAGLIVHQKQGIV